MLPTIDLDDKTMFHTDKVYNIAHTWRLPPEMKSPLSPRPQVNPDFTSFGFQRFAELSCDLVGHPPPGSLRSPPSPFGGGIKLSPSHALQHPLHMSDRRLRQDAMTEIEDMRAACESLQHRIDFTVERFPTGQ